MKLINIKEYFKQEKSKLRQLCPVESTRPALMIIDAGDGNPASEVYMRNKLKDFTDVGWKAAVVKAHSSEQIECLLKNAEGLGFNCAIVQFPVAEGIVFKEEMMPTWLDCDGLNAASGVVPATARGIIDYLDACGFEYTGKRAVVLGRSKIVGEPIAKELLKRDMTITVCHSKTREEDRLNVLKDADLVIAAVGIPGFLRREDCKDAIVIDVGINRVDGKLMGDFAREDGDELATPVPGGVGLLTRLGLMRNCYDL